jgi:hypothetical protein
MNRATRISIAHRAWVETQPDYPDANLWIDLDGYLITFTPNIGRLEAAGFEIDWSVDDYSPLVEIPRCDWRKLESLVKNGRTIAIASRRPASQRPHQMPLFAAAQEPQP